METKHTEGPWKFRSQVGKGGFGFYIETVDQSHDRTFIGEIGGGLQPNSEIEANARLIAASPDLLDALLSITSNPHIYLSDLVYDVREREGQGWDGPHVKKWGEAVEKVKTVLEKLGYDQPI